MFAVVLTNGEFCGVFGTEKKAHKKMNTEGYSTDKYSLVEVELNEFCPAATTISSIDNASSEDSVMEFFTKEIVQSGQAMTPTPGQQFIVKVFSVPI